MGQVIAVLSGKGGTGKTAFSANVAVSLCAQGQRVLLIDADAGLRNLDIVLGVQGTLLFSYADVLAGNASLKEAAQPHHQVKNLRVLTAPGSCDSGNRHLLTGLFDRCRQHFDFTLIDCPAGLNEDIYAIACAADRVAVVSTPDTSALRIAQAAGMALDERGQGGTRLVINRAKKRLMLRGDTPGVDQAMDLSGMPLLGVIPEDEDVMVCGNRGRVLLLNAEGPALSAYGNVARRLLGHRVPLFDGVKGF